MYLTYLLHDGDIQSILDENNTQFSRNIPNSPEEWDNYIAEKAEQHDGAEYLEELIPYLSKLAAQYESSEQEIISFPEKMMSMLTNMLTYMATQMNCKSKTSKLPVFLLWEPFRLDNEQQDEEIQKAQQALMNFDPNYYNHLHKIIVPFTTNVRIKGQTRDQTLSREILLVAIVNVKYNEGDQGEEISIKIDFYGTDLLEREQNTKMETMIKIIEENIFHSSKISMTKTNHRDDASWLDAIFSEYISLMRDEQCAKPFRHWGLYLALNYLKYGNKKDTICVECSKCLRWHTLLKEENYGDQLVTCDMFGHACIEGKLYFYVLYAGILYVYLINLYYFV